MSLPEAQRRTHSRDEGLLVMGVGDESPAATGGIIVGDIVIDFDGQPIRGPEDLLDLLVGDRVGRAVTLRVLRGGTPVEISLVPGERPSR